MCRIRTSIDAKLYQHVSFSSFLCMVDSVNLQLDALRFKMIRSSTL